MTGDVLRTDTWFDVSTRLPRPDETWVGTAPMPRQRPEAFALVKKLIVPTVVVAVVGILVGGYIAFRGEGGKRKPAKAPTIAAAPSVVAAPVAPAAHPEPVATPSMESPNAATASAGGVQPQPPTKEEAAAKQAAVNAAELGTHPGGGAPPAATATGASAPPAGLPASTAVREIRTPQGVLTFVDVRIDSKPAGATVMLVDNGKTSFLGTTPISTSLDPSRGYDVILSLSGRPTQMAHLDPTKQSRLEVVLGKPMPQVRPEKAVAATELKVETPAKAEPAAKPESAAPSAAATEPASKPFSKDEAHHHHHATPVEAKSETTDKPSDAAGEGELMVSSKPPCEIWIDGKSTGLTTPQKSIPLAVGTHKVTFVNEAENIKKTVAISITADQPTKLIQDLMKK